MPYKHLIPRIVQINNLDLEVEVKDHEVVLRQGNDIIALNREQAKALVQDLENEL